MTTSPIEHWPAAAQAVRMYAGTPYLDENVLTGARSGESQRSFKQSFESRAHAT